jgi:phosphoribosylanthranilate isomerase
MTRIKVCGITSVADAVRASELGANAIGMVFALSPRQVDMNTAIKITEALPQYTGRVGVFVDERPNILEMARLCQLDALQLHGEQSEAFAKKIMAYRRVIRVLRVRDGRSLVPIETYKSADWFLIDTFSKDAHGGTGETCDWDFARRAKEYGVMIGLAGGLNPDNVVDAIRHVRPFAVDVSSGVESSPGKKDFVKLKEFIDNVRSFDATAG